MVYRRQDQFLKKILGGLMLKSLMFIASLLLAQGCMQNDQTTSKSLVVVQSSPESAEIEANTLESLGFDVAGVDHGSGTIEVVANSQDEVVVLESDYAVASVTPSQSYNNYLDDSDEDSYYGPEESLQALQDLESSHNTLAQVWDLNKMLGVDKTEGGRAVYALQVSNNPGQLEDRPTLLIIGNHHARELMTHHAVIDSARDYLAKADAGDAETLAALENYEVWFVPVVNPDGLAYVFSDERMWRKNRASNRGAFGKGVDLNRNYDFKWGECGSNSSSPGSDIFRGFEAHSEPEVQVMDALNQVLQAEYVISYHSSGNEVLYPYVCGSMAEKEVYYGVRDRLASEISFGKRVASSSGEDFEHHYARYGSLSFLLEVGRSFQPDFSVYESTVKPNLLKVVPFLLNELKQPMATIKVVNGANGTVIPGAELKVVGVTYGEGESRNTDGFGTYRWRLPQGLHELSIDAPGFEPRIATINNARAPQNHLIELSPRN
jgi:hypothetical protein